MNENSGKCPICGKDNGCAFHTGENPSDCWCMTTKIPAELRKLSRELGEGKSCICKECVRNHNAGILITKK